jgi:leucyl-tRNA synthetase
MAKSTGNVVNPFFAVERFGVDVMRYYLAHDGGIQNDADYGNLFIVERYKKGLQGGLGNLVSRITRPKKWSVHEAVQAASKGFGGLNQSSQDQAELVATLAKRADAYFEKLNPGLALQTIMDVVFEVRTRSRSRVSANCHRRTNTCTSTNHGSSSNHLKESMIQKRSILPGLTLIRLSTIRQRLFESWVFFFSHTCQRKRHNCWIF